MQTQPHELEVIDLEKVGEKHGWEGAIHIVLKGQGDLCLLGVFDDIPILGEIMVAIVKFMEDKGKVTGAGVILSTSDDKK